MKPWKILGPWLFWGLCMGCWAKAPPVVLIKVLKLNPSEHMSTSVRVSGKIVEKDAHGVFFTLEDETATLLVTSQEISDKIQCPIGQFVTVQGYLKEHEGLFYLVLEAPPLC